MIIYDLRCSQSHLFEGWFKTAAEYHQQLAGGLLCCPVCGISAVKKLPTASRINRHSSSRPQEAESKADPEQVLLTKIHEYVGKNYVNVGAEFPEKARKMHYGEVKPASICGVASAKDVKELHDEGVAIVALPAAPVEKEKLN